MMERMQPDGMAHEVTLCVILRSLSDPLARLFEGLTEQSARRTSYDLVVVDASADGIEVEVDDRLPSVTVVRADPSLPRTALLNIAWQHARGRGVAFLDVSLVPAPGWVQAMTRALRRGRRLVTGRVEPQPSSLDRAGPLSYRLWSTPHEVALLPSEAFACLRTDLASVGGWDESIADPDLCDTDLAVRLADSGVDPFWARHAVAFYDVDAHGLPQMLAARRRVEPMLDLLAEHPRARARLLVGGVLWHRRQLEVLLAVTGVALAARDRRSLLLAAPWLHERLCLHPATGGPRRKLLVLPGVFAFDAIDTATTTMSRFRAGRGG